MTSAASMWSFLLMAAVFNRLFLSEMQKIVVVFWRAKTSLISKFFDPVPGDAAVHVAFHHPPKFYTFVSKVGAFLLKSFDISTFKNDSFFFYFVQSLLFYQDITKCQPTYSLCTLKQKTLRCSWNYTRYGLVELFQRFYTFFHCSALIVFFPLSHEDFA